MFANNSYRRIPYLTEYCRKHLLGGIWEDELDSDDEKSDLIQCSPSLYCDPERLGAKTWIDHLYDGNILCDQIAEHVIFRRQFIRAHGHQLMDELEKDCRQVTIELCKKYPAFVDDVSREALLDDDTASWLEGLLGGGIVVKRLSDRF